MKVRKRGVASKGSPNDHIASLSSLLIRHEKLMTQLVAFSGWSRAWTENLWAYCKSLKPFDSDTIPRNDFSCEMISLFGLTSSLFIDRTFDVFRRFSPTGKLTPEAMFMGISKMLMNDLETKINYVFDIYDFNFDGDISFDELSTSLKDSLVEEDFEAREEGLKEIFELVRKFLDLSADGSITRAEFRYRVHQNGILLEILGPCLPSATCKKLFLDLISPEKISTFDLQQKLEDRKKNAITAKPPKPDQYYPILIVLPSKDDLKRLGRKTIV